MTLFRDVIDRTRVRLLGQQREAINTLAVGIDNVAPNLTFSNAVRFIEGARLSIGLETMLVSSVSSGGANASVIRGVDGSAAVPHSAGDKVFITPTWHSFEIANAINDELHDLSSPANGLFRIRTAPDIIYNPSQAGYNLAGLTDFLDVWRVRYDTPGPLNEWKPIPRSRYRIDRAADTSEFAAGVQIVLFEGGYPGHKIRVTYKATYSPLVNETDDVLTVAGLHVQAHDILSLGAAYRLMGGSEAQRSYTTSQADPRRGDEAPTTSHARSMASFGQVRKERIAAEAIRLARQYPEALF